MRSKASINGHSLHPMLVSFPIAFFVGTLVFDLLGWVTGKSFYTSIAPVLTIAGLITAVGAAIPGVIDLMHTIPPKSSAKERGVRHGFANTGVLLLFGIVLWYRMQSGAPNMAIILLLELAGSVLLLIAGWMGGTLVSRNQIGIDHRFANAGKWKEFHLTSEKGRVEITGYQELKTDQMMLVHVDGKRIVVAKTAQGFAAFDDHCPHRGGSLAGGIMICGTVQCPWHGSQFEVDSGKLKAVPSKKGIPVYAMQEVNGKLFLQLP